MNIAIIDYESGNISSVINSFRKVCNDQNIEIEIEVTSDLKTISSSDKIILPGQGSFKSCIESLEKIKGLKDTLNEFAIIKKKPLFGICVGMQMFADVGYEETETKGLGWIAGNVKKLIIKKISLSFPTLVGMSFLLLQIASYLETLKKNHMFILFIVINLFQIMRFMCQVKLIILK